MIAEYTSAIYAAAFDLVSIRRGEIEDPRVYAGEIIVVAGSGKKEAQKKFSSTFRF